MNEDLKNMVKVLEMIKELKKSFEDSKKEKEENEEEDFDKLKEIHKQYEEMNQWAFSKEFDQIEKDKLKDIWSAKHPDLPELYIPMYVSNDIAVIVVLMQVMPYWLEHKKRHNL
jgi:hypothetical protein